MKRDASELLANLLESMINSENVDSEELAGTLISYATGIYAQSLPKKSYRKLIKDIVKETEKSYVPVDITIH